MTDGLVNTKWKLDSDGFRSRFCEGKLLTVEPRGANLYEIRINGIYIDTREGVSNCMRYAVSSFKAGKYL